MTITKWLLSHLLFAGTMFFAAGAPPLTGDAGAGADAGDDTSSDLGGYSDDTGETADDTGADDTADKGDQQDDAQGQDGGKPSDDDFKPYTGLASQRLRSLTKAAPELVDVLKKYPKVQEQLEAAFRRDAGYREAFPTLREANQMREHFPNGLSDVQQLMSEVQEVEALDRDFASRDSEGNYPGHAKIIGNMFQDDREAAVSLFKSLPNEWARLDRDSYNEVMGNIVGATLHNAGVLNSLQDMVDAAKEAKNDALANGLQKILNWGSKFLAEKPRPTIEEERLQKRERALNQQTQERQKEETQRFHQGFVSSSRKLQADIIKGHPAVARLFAANSVSESKKADIVEQIRRETEKFLGKSRSFMNKLRPAHQSRNLDETIKIQKAAWSQQWLLNKMVRTVLQKETPQLVQNNREAVRRRAGAPPAKTPVNAGDRNTQKSGPVKIGGRWYRDGGKGAPFTTQEVLAGKHLQS